MVNTCVVLGCNFSYSRHRKNGKGISIHRFPTREGPRKSWINAIGRENWQPTSASGVCSQHFAPEDMDLTGQTRRLREGAIPSIFPPYRSHLQAHFKTPDKAPSMAEPEVKTGIIDEIVKEEDWLHHDEDTEMESPSSAAASSFEVDPLVHVETEIKEEIESEEEEPEEEQLAPFDFVSVPAIKTEEEDGSEDPLCMGEQAINDEQESLNAYEDDSNFDDFSGNTQEELSYPAENLEGTSSKSQKTSKLKPLQCELCEATFSKNWNLKIHMRKHAGEKPYKCDVCEKSFLESSSLKKHKKIHTGEKHFMCDICDKFFLMKSSWERHKLLHKMKPFQCDVCERSYVSSLALSIHKRIHTEPKPYICQVCGAEFRQSHNLSKHKHIHTGVKPFSCDVCGKSFSQKYNLKIHKQIHTGEKPFQCLVCSESFRAKEKLIIHQRKHTGEKPYECNVCGKAFSILTSYKVHIKTHDPNRQ